MTPAPWTSHRRRRQRLGQDDALRARKQRTPRPAARAQTRILIATDILSEGQNRQDCGRALNRDRRQNSVTLIQRYRRCGRVDRITAEHEVIHRHNMLPDAGVGQHISLTGRLSAPPSLFTT